MYQIDQEEPSSTFKRVWQLAGHHLQQKAQDGFNWLRANLNPPLAEHLSFIIGNQLIFVYVEAAEFTFQRNKELFLNVAKEANAIPCIMPMTEGLIEFQPSAPGWGLIHAVTGKVINPLELISEELIEMSDWELHDFAIQIVKSHLKKENKNVFSAQSSLQINPSIWFETSGKANWVLVRAVRYPKKEAKIPDNIEDIALNCSRMGKTGYFASVAVSSDKDPFDVNGNVVPLYRGHGMYVKFEGLIKL